MITSAIDTPDVHEGGLGVNPVSLRPRPTQADVEALLAAGERVQAMLDAAGITEDEIVAEFRRIRRQERLEKAG